LLKFLLYDGFKSDGLGTTRLREEIRSAPILAATPMWPFSLSLHARPDHGTVLFHVAGLGHLFGKSDYEFDRAAYIEFRIGKKIKAAITDIPCLCFEFQSARFVGKTPAEEGSS